MKNNSVITVPQTGDRLFVCFLLLVFWLPIPLGSHRPWAWALMELASFLTMGAWLLKARRRDFAVLKPYSLLLAAFGIFQVWVAMQLVPLPIGMLELLSPFAAQTAISVAPNGHFASISLDPNQTFVGLLKGLNYWCLLFLALALINGRHRLKQFALVFVAAGTFQACYGVMHALSGAETSWLLNMPNWSKDEAIATGSFVYKNHFGNFLVMCLCVGIGLLVSSLAGKRTSSLKNFLAQAVDSLLNGKIVLRLLLAIMVIGLVMSHSRMANTAFFASLSIAGVIGLILIKHKSRSLSTLLISLLMIDLAIFGSFFGVEEIKTRLESTSMATETRDDVLVRSLNIMQDSPLTGTGAGSFYSTFPSYTGPWVKGFGFYDHTHNDYLQFAIEFGVPATLLLLMIVMWSLVLAIKGLRLNKDPLLQGMSFAATMGIVAQAIMIAVDFHLQAPATAVYFLMVLVIAWKAWYLRT